ncbi:hypothetical protein [Brevibacillus reuszeri]|uniref:hypothetical protein n=1 Tax=Brevibacillus reuszeri TaxID=54915 RepID=UPI0013DF3FB9|nr:hypothetical protein [Brevibacillus reuszeri]
MKNRQLPLAIPTNLILAFTWEKGIKKNMWRAVVVGRKPEEALVVNSARHLNEVCYR